MQLEPAQRTDEWFQARLGKVTASRISDVLAKTKTGYGVSRANYMAELIAERLTGEPPVTYSNSAIQWGLDKEPEARAAYAFMFNTDVQETGFVPHPTIAMSGASPDGLVGSDGLIEIKCPNTATHIETFMADAVPTKYVPQMLWQMECTGRAWCDFVSYDPRMPDNLRIFRKRLFRNDERLAEITGEVIKFLGELDGKISTLETIAKREAA